MNTLGSVIREARLAKNLTLRELGEKLSLTHGHLSNIENNKRTPSVQILSKLSKLLDLDGGELMVLAGHWDEKERKKNMELLHEIKDMTYRDFITSEMSKQHVKLEKVIKENENVYLNNALLNEKQKEKMLKLLELVFESEEDDYPTFEEFVESQIEKDIIEKKKEAVEMMLMDGEIDEEEAEYFDLDDLELDEQEIKEITQRWRRF